MNGFGISNPYGVNPPSNKNEDNFASDSMDSDQKTNRNNNHNENNLNNNFYSGNSNTNTNRSPEELSDQSNIKIVDNIVQLPAY